MVLMVCSYARVTQWLRSSYVLAKKVVKPFKMTNVYILVNPVILSNFLSVVISVNSHLESNNKFYYHRNNTDCKYYSYPAFALVNSPMTSNPTPKSHPGSQAESDFPTHFAVEGEYNQCKDRIDTNNKYLVAIRYHKIKFKKSRNTIPI